MLRHFILPGRTQRGVRGPVERLPNHFDERRADHGETNERCRSSERYDFQVFHHRSLQMGTVGAGSGEPADLIICKVCKARQHIWGQDEPGDAGIRPSRVAAAGGRVFAKERDPTKRPLRHSNAAA